MARAVRNAEPSCFMEVTRGSVLRWNSLDGHSDFVQHAGEKKQNGSILSVFTVAQFPRRWSGRFAASVRGA
uniref:Uncharacterized protein n=1 Tax=Physcomitrium patens TaxID=3218 RepID=A0A2K1INS7_PHYPA|nr:hypothetical protein PHYPA_027224 [Physcomitrium patens]